MSPFDLWKQPFEKFITLCNKVNGSNEIENEKYITVNGKTIKKVYASDNENI